MELDFLDTATEAGSFKPREIEEALEDPFSIRFLPENDRSDGETRFYAIGRALSDNYLFIVFTTDGKKVRIFACRDATENEITFYERKFAEFR